MGKTLFSFMCRLEKSDHGAGAGVSGSPASERPGSSRLSAKTEAFPH